MTTELDWRSRFVYGVAGSETDWSTIRPVRSWTNPTATVGGSRTSASGTPAAYVARRDYNLRLTLRLYESELPDLQALIEWGQAAESFTWYPDANDTATSFEVYLESPLAGDEWEEARLDEFPRVVEVTIVLRRVDGYAWGLEYFEESGS